jgi:hypothetical protein
MGVLGPRGFAVGGGLALQLHGFGDRPTEDLDSYLPRFEAEPFSEAADALLAALREAGYEADVAKSMDVFRAIRVSRAGATRDGSGRPFVIDIGYHQRTRPEVTVGGVGPVESLEDAVIGKLAAVCGRARRAIMWTST